MSPAEAGRWARLLHEWGYDEVQIVQRVPSGERFIRARNRCGQTRWVNNVTEFKELRELAATRSSD